MAANQFLSLPAAATGLSLVSSATAWAYGSPVTLAASLASDIAVIGFEFHNTDIPAVDTNQDILFEITVGGTTMIQLPFNMKADSLVGYDFAESASIQAFYFPEPYFIPAGSAVAVKVTDSIAAALTYNGVKILYNELSHPATVLNSPADASSDSDTTPVLDFTGTDGDAAMAVEYQVQVDTVNTFDSINTIDLGIIQVYLEKNATPTDDLKLEIFSGSITGTSLGFVTIASASITDNAMNSFDFTGQSIVLSSNTQYYLQLTRSGARDATNYWKWIGFSNYYSGGQQYGMASGTWAAGGFDFYFRVFDTSSNVLAYNPFTIPGWYYQIMGSGGLTEAGGQSFTTPAATPLLSELSATDAGFTANHPFASATPIDFTVQSALTADTYYWRVRAVRAGSTDYGDWSSIRSFDVAGGGSVIKTINSLVIASIKTFNGLAVASCKNINGVT